VIGSFHRVFNYMEQTLELCYKVTAKKTKQKKTKKKLAVRIKGTKNEEYLAESGLSIMCSV
jgi:hypothetical protein